ncbi:MAG TPA: Rne/Rng family ribonuclease [Terriglobales bacterium]|nr:Rne/Rng family ribonuclease [Terriglobales bacterium]
MSKELFVSSTPHETKVAIVEEDQLAEIYFERENEYTLAGSVYKGKVTRVLPGMQSAFVDIGLERDAFLYVTDFLEEQEDQEEFDRIITEAHDESVHGRGPEPVPSSAPILPPAEPIELRPPAEPAPAQNVPEERGDDRNGGRWRNRRRRRRGGRGIPDSKFANEGSRAEAAPGHEPEREQPREPERPRESRPPRFGPPAGYQPIILPGESISKYRNLPPQPPTAVSAAETTAPEHVEASANVEPQRNVAEQWTAEDRARYEEPRDTGDVRAAAVVPTPDTQEPPRELLDAAAHEAREAAARSEQMNVAAVFGGEAATREEPPVETPGRASHEHLEPPPPAAFAPGQGVLEEETIEEEETEQAGFSEASDDIEFEELEEETLEHGAQPFNGETPNSGPEDIGEEVKLHTAESLAEGEYEEDTEEVEGEEEGFEEAEAEAEAEVSAEGAEQEEGARAELRAPTGTAGYQQRGGQRPGFDRRRGRGRRGGRRMGGGPRRNIQRGGQPQISELLKEGQEILVQIAKEPMGKKGARITSHIALPGRYLVFMPTVNHIGVSRKIASDEERQRLKRILQSEHAGPGGFIVRTAAAGASEDDLRADVRFLLNLWSEIRHRADDAKAPALIYHDLNLVERILRDQVTQNFSQIWVDTESEYERVLRFANRFQPGLVKRVKLYSKETPLFEQFNIQDELNKALKSKVWLKSGGYIVINQTEALVAIDINTGKYVGKTARLEDTIVKTNVDAVKEIVRQIRLRDLGGIIVIDFIDMDERRNRQKVLQALEEELRHDRAPSKVLQFNDFGLVAITRKRVKQSLERTLGQPCSYCTGTGLIKSVSTVCNEIYVEMRKVAKHLEGRDVVLRVNPEVAKALKANNARWLTELEELTRRNVIVKSDPLLHQEQFDIN